jgi:hypothetical protein
MSAKGFFVAQDGHLASLISPISSAVAEASRRFSMALFHHASIILQLGAAGGPIGAITLSVFTAPTGGAGVAIPYRLVKFENSSAPYDVASNNPATNSSIFQIAATGYTPAADLANAMYVLEIDSADLLAAGNGGTYLELDIAIGSEGTTAQLMSAVAILSAGRNVSDQSPSVQV